MSNFMPGLMLSELFYGEAIRPILDKNFPGLKYSAALLGYGSDVLGYDTPLSTDHMWGPRALLILEDKNFENSRKAVSSALRENLPLKFYGYSTHFSEMDNDGIRVAQEVDSGPVNHLIQIYTLKSFFQALLDFDPYAKITPLDWLTFPQQKLLEVTSGRVFYDGLEELNLLREKFAFYPRDIWFYLLSSQWQKISQEEAFMGRCGEAGDELGSRIVAASLVRELIKLCFLMERRYAPYTKWLGTAFSRLEIAGKIMPFFQAVLEASGWNKREELLAGAYKIVAEKHNGLEITRPLETGVSNYHNRPFLVIHADVFANEIRKAIEDEAVRKIKLSIGGIDQFVDHTGLLSNPRLCSTLKDLYL